MKINLRMLVSSNALLLEQLELKSMEDFNMFKNKVKMFLLPQPLYSVDDFFL